jgi:hypothetical protein
MAWRSRGAGWRHETLVRDNDREAADVLHAYRSNLARPGEASTKRIHRLAALPDELARTPNGMLRA